MFAASPIQSSPLPTFDPNAGGTPQTINQIFLNFAVFNMVKFVPALILVGLVTFLAGVVSFVNAGDNEEKRAAGRSVMVYGIIVLFVMISLWGLVSILTQSFFTGSYSKPTLPNYLPDIIK